MLSGQSGSSNQGNRTQKTHTDTHISLQVFRYKGYLAAEEINRWSISEPWGFVVTSYENPFYGVRIKIQSRDLLE